MIVWTVPHRPDLCGTTKFTYQLANRLGVPCLPLPGDVSMGDLVSVRASEAESVIGSPAGADLFLHDMDVPDDSPIWAWVEWAGRVFAANVDIAARIRPIRGDVVVVSCPSTIRGDATRGTFNVLTFGMAHKIKSSHYEALKARLDAEHGDDYTVSVSTAVHEGSPWDATAEVADRLRAIFGLKLRVLGYLADDALAKEMADCDAIALFYEPALRANNTTYWAAVAAGKPVFTNRDAESPREGETCSWDDVLSVVNAGRSVGAEG